MKFLISLLAAIFCVVLAAPAFAQSTQAEAEFQRFLSRHPDVQANPALLSDKNYLYHHPNIATFLKQHPSIHQQALMMGAYDQGHVWRDSNWWYQHDPKWAYQNHPEWYEHHPDWRRPTYAGPVGEGDYDEQHEWHDKKWWKANKKEWAEQHHPEWNEQHGNQGYQGKQENEGHDHGHHGHNDND